MEEGLRRIVGSVFALLTIIGCSGGGEGMKEAEGMLGTGRRLRKNSAWLWSWDK